MDNRKKVLYILRGPSGSGKSTLSAKIVAENDGNGLILSTDDYFINQKTGEYNWAGHLLGKAHYWNQIRCLIAMEKHVTPILIDNTTLNAWEAYPYAHMAIENDYMIEIAEPEGWQDLDPEVMAARNSHGVPLESIKKMLSNYTPYTVQEALHAAKPPSRMKPLPQKDKQQVETKVRSYFDPIKTSKTAPEKAKEPVVETPKPVEAPQVTVKAARIEVTKNDGQKSVLKLLVVRDDDFEAFKKQACNQLKLRYGKGTRVFTLHGDEVLDFSGVTQTAKAQFAISADGRDFIPIALKMTAEEKRAKKIAKTLEEGSPLEEPNNNTGTVRKTRHIPVGMNAIVDGFLYLGSARDAQDEEQLIANKITHVLNLTHEFPASRQALALNITVDRVEIKDVETQHIIPHLQKCWDIIDAVKVKNGRILVHCVVGKSRSASLIISYLLHTQICTTLKDSYLLVKSKRPLIRPNSGFLRQLMKLETDSKGLQGSTLAWSDVLDENMTILDWLSRYSTSKGSLKKVNHAPTHIWSEILTKDTFTIPPYLFPELQAYCARALQAGQPTKLIEIPSKKHKLHLDVDICLTAAPSSPQQLLQDLLEPLLAAVTSAFPGKDAQRFSCTASNAPHFSVSDETVKHKTGFHLVWPEIEVIYEQRLNFVTQLITAFEKIPVDTPTLANVTECQGWYKIFDLEGVKNVMAGLRTLGSLKMSSCKECKKMSNANKKKKKPGKCLYCNDTGLLDPRPHTLLKHVDCVLGDVQPPKTAAEWLEQLVETSIFIPNDEIIVHPDVLHTKPKAEDNTPVLFTAAVLDEPTQISLLRQFTAPQAWPEANWRGHHINLCLGPNSPSTHAIIGQRIPWKIETLGRSKKAIALGVTCMLQHIKVLANNMPHITLAFAHQAKDGSSIEEWTPLPEPIYVYGTVVEVTKKMHVNYTEVEQAKLVAKAKLPSPARNPISNATEYHPHILQLLHKTTWNELAKEFRLKAVRHETYRELVQFSYMQDQGSDMSLPVVQECRGLVVDTKKGAVVAFPYTKFFNYGEKLAAKIDWNTAVVTEKVDGSIASLYYHDKEWCVASASVPDGSALFPGSKDETFAQVFWRIWKELGYQLPEPGFTYIFELLTTQHTIVLEQKRNALLLHGVRSHATWEEVEPLPVAARNGWEYVREFAFDSLGDLVSACGREQTLTDKMEGFVVRDSMFRRVKIKTQEYVALHYLKSHSPTTNSADTNKALLQVVLCNETDEFLLYFPEYQNPYLALTNKLDTLLSDLLSLLGQEVVDEEEQVAQVIAALQPHRPLDASQLLQHLKTDHYAWLEKQLL